MGIGRVPVLPVSHLCGPQTSALFTKLIVELLIPIQPVGDAEKAAPCRECNCCGAQAEACVCLRHMLGTAALNRSTFEKSSKVLAKQKIESHYCLKE